MTYKRAMFLVSSAMPTAGARDCKSVAKLPRFESA